MKLNYNFQCSAILFFIINFIPLARARNTKITKNDVLLTCSIKFIHFQSQQFVFLCFMVFNVSCMYSVCCLRGVISDNNIQALFYRLLTFDPLHIPVLQPRSGHFENNSLVTQSTRLVIVSVCGLFKSLQIRRQPTTRFALVKLVYSTANSPFIDLFYSLVPYLK